MSQPLVEDDTRPCPYNRADGPCPGHLEPELDGGQQYWACTSCGGEVYGAAVQAPGTCQMGLPIDVARSAQPDGPVFLGTTIGRRPQ